MRVILAVSAVALLALAGCDSNTGPQKTAKVECNCSQPPAPPPDAELFPMNRLLSTVELVPGVTVRHIIAGPLEGLDKNDLPAQLCAFTSGVMREEAAHVACGSGTRLSERRRVERYANRL